MTNDLCPDCYASPGEAHENGCDQARCLITGQQRLMCHEDHDCGEDVWRRAVVSRPPWLGPGFDQLIEDIARAQPLASRPRAAVPAEGDRSPFAAPIDLTPDPGLSTTIERVRPSVPVTRLKWASLRLKVGSWIAGTNLGDPR